MALVKLFLQRLVHILQAHPQRRIVKPQHLVRLFPAENIRLGVDLLARARLSTGDLLERRTGEVVNDVDNVLAVEGAV